MLEYGKHHKELSQGYQLTTNNRMEMLATIEGLRALKRSCQVILTTDSLYVKLCIEQFIGTLGLSHLFKAALAELV